MLEVKAFDAVQTGQNIIMYSGDTTPLPSILNNATILIHEVFGLLVAVFRVVHI